MKQACRHDPMVASAVNFEIGKHIGGSLLHETQSNHAGRRIEKVCVDFPKARRRIKTGKHVQCRRGVIFLVVIVVVANQHAHAHEGIDKARPNVGLPIVRSLDAHPINWSSQ